MVMVRNSIVLSLNRFVPEGRGVVGAVARNSLGHVLALAASEDLRPGAAYRGSALPSTHLIRPTPASAEALAQCDAVRMRSCVDAGRILGESAYRIANDGRFSGIVTRLCGAVRLHSRDRCQESVFTQLIEVRFDQRMIDEAKFEQSVVEPGDRGRSYRPVRPLTQNDAGALVVTSDDEAIGLLVAGSDYTAYVAPLEPFLKVKGLSLGLASEADSTADRERDSRIYQGHSAYIDDLAREESLGLEELMEVA